MSNSVAKALELYGGEEAKESAILADMFNHFFDCVNVSSFTAGKGARDPFKSPYRSGKDFRLKVCDIVVNSKIAFILLYSG